MSDRFNKAINSLVKAYFKGTLAKGTCKACAVGNIVADSLGLEVQKIDMGTYGEGYWCFPTDDGISVHDWNALFVTNAVTNIQTILAGTEEEIRRGRLSIKNTGYNEDELARVEHAFEITTKLRWDKYSNYTPEEISADQYNGLMAVVDVLCDIEGIEDVSEYKAMFDKQLA